ncbi:hypothetical protein TSUD_84400 [Trifolium subterraneum]|uniref:Transmembrane protein n=1 Tax=Trifolium subterraneum TaxID=3900 RepID=A0A2Z6NLR3_TRISU|nr:hypothetical protein TSUD_84400 [Trifolium subterraneum]
MVRLDSIGSGGGGTDFAASAMDTEILFLLLFVLSRFSSLMRMMMVVMERWSRVDEGDCDYMKFEVVVWRRLSGTVTTTLLFFFGFVCLSASSPGLES